MVSGFMVDRSSAQKKDSIRGDVLPSLTFEIYDIFITSKAPYWAIDEQVLGKKR